MRQRRCAFFARSGNTDKVLQSGNVDGTTQYCEKSQCCMGYFKVVDGHFSPDLLGCTIAEVPCQDTICSASLYYVNHTKCMCNSDFCNSKMTWTPEMELSQLSTSQASGEVVLKDIAVILFCLILMMLLLVMGHKLRPHLSYCGKKAASSTEGLISPCSCYVSALSDILVDSIKLQKIVATGQYGTVWQSRYQENEVALKLFPVENHGQFVRERAVHTLPLMVHAGMVHFLGAGQALSGEAVLVLKLASHGSLNSYLSKTVITWSDALRLSKSLAEGLAHLHSDLYSDGKHKPPVAHRDLSSNNVLVQEDGTCVLCDFGSATILHTCGGAARWQCRSSTSEEPVPLGTMSYMSPEILDRSVDLTGGHCLLQGDVYALGLLLWEMWMRCSDLFPGQATPEHHLPYEVELGLKPSPEQLLDFVFEKRGRPTIPSSWSKVFQTSTFSLQEILEDCWDHDPEARLTAQCAANRITSLYGIVPLVGGKKSQA